MGMTSRRRQSSSLLSDLDYFATRVKKIESSTENINLICKIVISVTFDYRFRNKQIGIHRHQRGMEISNVAPTI